MVNLYKKSGADGIGCYIRKNGNVVARAGVPAESEAGYYEGSGSTVLHLDPGDKVDVDACGNPRDIISYTSFVVFFCYKQIERFYAVFFFRLTFAN